MSADSYEEHLGSNHQADEATDLHEQELEIGFQQDADNLLQRIDHALELMDKGRYGYDEETGEEIPLERLQVMPYATRTVRNQTQAEA
jgi:RNA polymerase-binding transcription factor DksA